MAKKPNKAAPPAPAGAINPSVLFRLASTGGEGFVTPEEGRGALAAGMIEVNTNILDPNDQTKAAARLTDAGKAFVAEHQQVETVQASAPASSRFVIDDGYQVPDLPPSMRGGREATYPFEALHVGQSFHVPVSEKLPDPASSLSTTVSAANRKYATRGAPRVKADGTPKLSRANEPTFEWTNTRVFALRPAYAADNPDRPANYPVDPRGNGARVFRLPDAS